jgi:hypothetical protein
MAITVRPYVTTKDILDNVSDIEIYRLIGIKDDDIGRHVISPLRKDDKRPSFVIRPSGSGRLNWKDYGTGDYGGAIDLYMRLYPHMTYDDILTSIWNNTSHTDARIIRNVLSHKTRFPEIKVILRKPDIRDIEFWQQYGITPDVLKTYRVHPISTFWLDRDIYPSNDQLVYGYDLISEWKIYRPFAKEMRFASGGSSLQGLHQLPDSGEKLIIQKSYKDVMLMYRMGLPSVAPQAESIMITLDQHRMLSERFKEIYIWGDSDDAGRKFIHKHNDLYGYRVLMNDDNMTKDATDHVKKFGYNSAENMLKRLLNESK